MKAERATDPNLIVPVEEDQSGRGHSQYAQTGCLPGRTSQRAQIGPACQSGSSAQNGAADGGAHHGRLFGLEEVLTDHGTAQSAQDGAARPAGQRTRDTGGGAAGQTRVDAGGHGHGHNCACLPGDQRGLGSRLEAVGRRGRGLLGQRAGCGEPGERRTNNHGSYTSRPSESRCELGVTKATPMLESFARLRQEYQNPPLRSEELDEDPLKEFEKWFALSVEREPLEPNAMTLVTADENGRPSGRMVLLKELDANGFVFFTNYDSNKGHDLELNPQAGLVFYWAVQHRQVRVEGRVEKLSEGESDIYFATRPRGAQIGAWASRQSRPIENRDEFHGLLAAVEERFPEPEMVARPPYWGGYRLIPDQMEFWQGQPCRLHDRIEYLKTDLGWSRRRLMP